MSKVIIGIHGLGNKPSKELLEKWWKIAITEGLRGIHKYIFNPKFEMIYWADVLNDKPLDETITDKDDPYYLEEKYTPAPKNFIPEPHPIKKKFLDFVEKQIDKIFLNEDLSINLSFITDMIIHRHFKELEIYFTSDCLDENNKKCTVRDLIRNTVSEVLQKYKDDEILLIGHSMGSIIAYDVLTFSNPEININTFATMGSPLGLPIIMSKIAGIKNSKEFKTKKMKTPEGIEKNWFNFSDLGDKVALNYNLGDDYDKNSKGIQANDIVVSNNYEINGEKNSHKSYGYLRTPEFSNVLYEFLLQDKLKPTRWLVSISNNVYSRLNKIATRTVKKMHSLIPGVKDEP